jgi:hypothetical protein
MLVHAATAPNAVLRALPALPARLWTPSLDAAWAATAAVTAAYSPARPRPPLIRVSAPEIAEVMHRAADSGDEHAIKFADTATDAYPRSGDDPAVAALAVASVALLAGD